VDRYYYSAAVGGWVLCFARHRLPGTHTARVSRNLIDRLASDRQKAVEINIPSFILSPF